MIDNAMLAAAACHERDHRAASYPARIAEGKSDPETASIDYQAWVAIAEWLETGNFRSFAGGAEPDRTDAPIVSWPALETAAKSALDAAGRKIDRIEADPDQQRVAPAKRLTAEQYFEKLTDLYVRRGRLICIHRKVQLRRQMVDSINREFRDRRQSTHHAQPEGISA
jgi:hypothetical protein